MDILIGNSGRSLLADGEFLSQWEALHAQCSEATAFQAPGFVRAWFGAYEDVYEPVVVRGQDAAGALSSLWLLAYDPVSKVLAHPGAGQAEYHGWLNAPRSNPASFLESAWAALRHRLRFESLHFEYLPQLTLLDTLRGTPSLASHLTFRLHRRPLSTLDPAVIEASFAKKSNRSRFNRLKKLGQLEFRRVREPGELECIFDQLIAQYDFRQGAVHHVSPFRMDPRKRPFHERLLSFAPEHTHLTVTLLDGEPIAGLWGMISDVTLHMGIIFYSPFFAQHSPGKLHIMELSRRLVKEGVRVLDLTPGDDAWKERFANTHDEVAIATLYRSEVTRAKVTVIRQLRAGVKRGTSLVRVDPHRLRTAATRIKRVRPGSLWLHAKRWVNERREFRIYSVPSAVGADFVRDPRVSVNSLPALLEFESIEADRARDGFLANSLARLEAGESIYTLIVDNHLAHYGWMIRNEMRGFMTEVQQWVSFPPRSVTLYDYYTHPAYRGRGLYRAMLRHMVRDAFIDDQTDNVYIAVLADNVRSRDVIESVGFRYRGSLYWRRRFGRQSRATSRAWELWSAQPRD